VEEGERVPCAEEGAEGAEGACVGECLGEGGTIRHDPPSSVARSSSLAFVADETSPPRTVGRLTALELTGGIKGEIGEIGP
jgi:hypothetical protein